jgi:16S rRNA (guanine527-N7)-methyltransferase
VSALGHAPLEPAVRTRLESLFALVRTWGARIDLTAAMGTRELVELYLADALIIASNSAPHGAWVDVGSGGGAPGLVLATLLPGATFTLVEPREKRVAFLRNAVGSLPLPNVTVLRDRSDVLPARSFDIAVSKATLPPPEWLAEGGRLARHRVWVLLARGTEPACAGWSLEHAQDYALPVSSAPRRALVYAPTASGD